MPRTTEPADGRRSATVGEFTFSSAPETGLGVGAALPEWLPALLQLSSPALPTGAFSYSQGLETACERGLVHDEASALAWIDSHWRTAFQSRELPTLDAAWHAAQSGGVARLVEIDETFVASRDSAESRAETLQVGAALIRWLRILHPDTAESALALETRSRLSAPVAYALCARAQGLPARAAVFGYGFAWLENQVQAAVKLVPLGQSAGQRLQMALRPRLADPLPQRPWSFAPIAAIMAMRHERQYTRIFRS
jgi:urease accessory protein